MEELQPEELEELLEELEGESEEQETLSPQVEELLQNLKPATRPMLRIRAAKQLGEITTSSRQVVQALTIAAETDSVAKVRATAAESLHAPVHQEWLQQHPELKEAAERALQPHPRSPTGDGPTVEESGKSFKSGIVWNLSWAVVYLLAVVGTSMLALERMVAGGWVGDWELWAAAVVWFGGGALGLVILVRKGHLRAADTLGWAASAPSGRGCWETLILICLLLALAGPLILPVALLIRPRDL